MKNFQYLMALSAVLLLPVAASAVTVTDNFSSNPLAAGSAWSVNTYAIPGTSASGSGDTSTPTYPMYTNGFEWNAPGLPAGLTTVLNSSTASTRLDHPLGTTLDGSQNFTLTANFTLNNIVAPSDGFMEIAFGLTNSTLTGGDRTGSSDSNFDYFPGNNFSEVEFNYFPNVDPQVPFMGPTLTPTVVGGPASASPFDNAASIFDLDSSLGNHSSGITSLADGTEYQAQLAFDTATQTITLAMYQVTESGVVLLNTDPTPLSLDLVSAGYNTSNPFEVNTLSIMAYNDGFATHADPSLVGDITYQGISLVSTPEPSSLVLTLIAGLCAAAAAVRRRVRRTVG